MITLKEFESLSFRRFFPEAEELSDPEDLAYTSEPGDYSLDVPGVRFGYGEKTGLRLAYIDCTAQGNAAEIKNARTVLNGTGFPYTLGDMFPTRQDAASYFTELKYRTNPYVGGPELKGFMGDFHVWIASDRGGKINLLNIHNVKVIEENEEGDIRKQLQIFA